MRFKLCPSRWTGINVMPKVSGTAQRIVDQLGLVVDHHGVHAAREGAGRVLDGGAYPVHHVRRAGPR
jgi:hypothetical protein